MRLQLTSTKYWDGRELLDRYSKLRNYGFKLEGTYKHELAYITVKTLDDILRLLAEIDRPIILTYDYERGIYTAEIYDDYRE